MALILGIDTATVGCSAAVMQGDICLAAEGARMARGQSEALAPMMQRVMAAAGIEWSMLDGIAVSRGPGAFTGLRIGLAAARAAALAIGRPCLGVETFDVLARQTLIAAPALAADALLIAIETKRDDLYLRLYGTDGQALAPGLAAPPEDLPSLVAPHRRIVVAGDAAARAVAALPGVDVILADVDALPDPRVVAALGAEMLATPALAPAEPIYLRPPDVTMPGTRPGVPG